MRSDEAFWAGWRRLLPVKEERRAGRSPYKSGRAERCARRTSPSSPRLRRWHEFGASRRTRLRGDRETLETCSSAKRTGLGIDGFYVEQTKRQ